MSQRLNVFLILIIVLLSLLLYKCGGDRNRLIDIEKAANEEIHYHKNKIGEQVASIQVMEGKYSELQALNSTKDKALQDLQRIVKRDTKTALVLGVVTEGEVKGKTEGNISADTVFTDKPYYLSPVFYFSDSSKWSVVSAVASRDSFLINYKIFNDFEIVTSSKLFRKELTVEVVDKNPYTRTINLKSFSKEKGRTLRVPFFVAGVVVSFLIFK